MHFPQTICLGAFVCKSVNFNRSFKVNIFLNNEHQSLPLQSLTSSTVMGVTDNKQIISDSNKCHEAKEK